jgi:pimeloyl-ACP methyl ester carboxylesterase
MATPTVARALILLQLGLGSASFGQAPARPLPSDSIDAAYRKFDAVETFVRNRYAASYAITTPNGSDEASFVRIGGIEQWVTIRGEDRNDPVLLFLHGGPGEATNPWSFTLFAPWQKHFTIVQWDQRGAGRTFGRNGAAIAPTVTVERLAQDGIELAEHLRDHLGKKKIIIVGHSFGTIIGVRMAQGRPDLFYAYVGTGQAADETGSRNYASNFDALRTKARQMHNAQALEELDRVGPPPYKTGEGYQMQRKWSNAFEGADMFLGATIGLALVAPGYSVRDVNDWFDGQISSGDQLVPEMMNHGRKEMGTEFAVPIFFFQGAEDFTSSTALAREYFDKIKAPHKEFVAIKDGGHFAVFMRSAEFLNELVERVRPLAMER